MVRLQVIEVLVHKNIFYSSDDLYLIYFFE